jgi:hypothetical protein
MAAFERVRQECDPDTIPLAEKDGLFTGAIEISYTATDLRTRVFPGGHHKMSLSWTEPGLEQARASGRRMVTTLDLPKGDISSGSPPAAAPPLAACSTTSMSPTSATPRWF